MNLKDLQEKLANIRRNIGNQQTMEKVAEETAKEVKARTKRGRGVENNGGKVSKLKPLKESTKRRRRRLKAAGNLSDETTPGKSNLTQKGDMINSVEGKGRRLEADIKVTGRKNRTKAEKHTETGRAFMNLSKREISKAVNIIEEDIINDIKKQGL